MNGLIVEDVDGKQRADQLIRLLINE